MLARCRAKNRGVDVSVDGLTQAIAKGQSGTVSVLMTAGLTVGRDHTVAATRAALAIAGADPNAPGMKGSMP